ncbi:MAG: hypothetical protein DRR08_27800 [Candidatus Parabeggiatoa sp. nov. 2]|nr:MAG: hypothetical protein B6247_26625 [Beggiatoa sp. 4572_84]RKZ52932.1 MAG: hypothetical protein DRR08_27800 [Gammaproteobacteria bacterium]
MNRNQSSKLTFGRSRLAVVQTNVWQSSKLTFGLRFLFEGQVIKLIGPVFMNMQSHFIKPSSVEGQVIKLIEAIINKAWGTAQASPKGAN